MPEHEAARLLTGAGATSTTCRCRACSTPRSSAAPTRRRPSPPSTPTRPRRSTACRSAVLTFDDVRGGGDDRRHGATSAARARQCVLRRRPGRDRDRRVEGRGRRARVNSSMSTTTSHGHAGGEPRPRSPTPSTECTRSWTRTSWPSAPRPTTPSSTTCSRPRPTSSPRRSPQHRYLAVPIEEHGGSVASWDPVQQAMTIWISTPGHAHRRPGSASWACSGSILPRGARDRRRRRRHVRAEDQRGREEHRAHACGEDRRPPREVDRRPLGEPGRSATRAGGKKPKCRARRRRTHPRRRASITWSDAGAYTGGPGVVGPQGPPMIVRFLTGPYRIARAGGSSTTASTNTMRGAYRGPVDVRDGRP